MAREERPRAGQRVALSARELQLTFDILHKLLKSVELGVRRDLAQRLGSSLQRWTGVRWAVSVVDSGGGPTIAETRDADELALELGAQIHGAVTDVFVNADGHKKSISAPGVGNYITVAKAVAAARNLLGEASLADGFVQAHGTGTPQNRVTESHILNAVAQHFGIDRWPVAAVKAKSRAASWWLISVPKVVRIGRPALSMSLASRR